MSTLNVRINQKFDTLSAWLLSSQGETPLILGAGEIAVAQIPAQQTDSGLTPPAVGIKVGDGTKTFAQLDWIQAVAGDVPGWAKKANLSYDDLSEEFKAKVAEELVHGEIQNTNTTYNFSYADGVLTIQHKEVGEDDWTDLASFDFDLDSKADVTYVDEELAKKANVGDAYTKAEADAKFETIENVAALEETVGGIAERVGTAEGKITTLEGQVGTLIGTGEGSVKKVAEDAAAAAVNAFATEVTDNGQVEKFKELVQWVANHGSDAGKMADAIQANTEAIAKLDEDSHVHGNKEVIDGITAEQVTAWDKAVTDLATEVTNRTNADTALQGAIDAEAKARGDEDTRLAGLIGDNADAIAALEEDSHTHANKEVLDGVSTDKVAAWDAAVQSISGVETAKTGTDVAVTAVPVTLLKNVVGNTLVLECGSASTVL